jgi:para-aminobenzoate synthetase component I
MDNPRLSSIILQGSPDDWFRRALAFSRESDPVCCLHSGEYKGPGPHRYDWVLAVGAHRLLQVQAHEVNAIEQLKQWLQPGHWTFLALSYDLKNEIEPRLNSLLPDTIGWPLIQAFEPEWLLLATNDKLELLAVDPQIISDQIAATNPIEQPDNQYITKLLPRQQKADYIDTINKLKEHIAAGDLYEVNYCQEFYTDQISPKFEPTASFYALQQRMQSPFAALWRTTKQSLISATPERFLTQTDDQLISQPIKGTSPRFAHPLRDQRSKNKLQQSPKDRAEHIMIVDLVRNDLAKISQTGTVIVPELMGLYAFARVHQMISTVSGTILPDTCFCQLLHAAFPMGSMTGAPKVMAMQLAERYEQTRRGIYSGSIGYINPAGDFDLNVVIRSLIVNHETQTAATHVGGAIIYDSQPEAEYQECLDKMAGLLPL